MSGYSGSANTRCGKGFSIGHAGELLQGAIWHDQKPEPFLVTLPAPPFTSRATISFTDEAEDGAQDNVEPKWRTKALRAARMAWVQIGCRAGSLRLVIESETPVGRGCGSSTSDCVAAIRAVGDLLGRTCSAEEIAVWSTQAEMAADATMFNLRPVAFRQRHGRVLRPLGQAYPPMRVITADLGGPSVDTITRPVPAYSDAEIVAFQDLLALLENSIEQGSALGVAQVATESAAIQQRYYPHPRWQEFVTAARGAGALGVGCAHSGSLAIAFVGQHEGSSEDRILADLARLDLPVLARYMLDAGPKGEHISCPLF